MIRMSYAHLCAGAAGANVLVYACDMYMYLWSVWCRLPERPDHYRRRRSIGSAASRVNCLPVWNSSIRANFDGTEVSQMCLMPNRTFSARNTALTGATCAMSECFCLRSSIAGVKCQCDVDATECYTYQ